MPNRSYFHIYHGGISLQVSKSHFIIVEIELFLQQTGYIQFFLNSHILDYAVLALDFQLEVKRFYELHHGLHHVRSII